jgi:DNA-binding transcriptional regulator YiaG
MYFTKGMERPGIKSEVFVRVDTPGKSIGEVLGMLTGGDALVIPSISHLGSKPSAIRAVVSQVISKGVQLHCLDLGGRAEAHWLGLCAGLDTAAGLEAELASLSADYEAAEARHAEELAQQREDLLMKFLHEGIAVTAKPNGHAASAVEQSPGVEHHESPATNVRTLRAKKNMSLQQLSDASGVSKTQLHRIEGGETVPEQDMAAVLSALGVGAIQGAIPSSGSEGRSNPDTLPTVESPQ